MNNAGTGNEEQCALLADSSASSGSTASVSDEETAARQPRIKLRGTMKLQRRTRLPLPRILRRFGCYTLMALFIFLLLLVYLPLMYMDGHKRRVGLPDWTLETSRSIGDYIDPVQETALIVPREFCRNKTFLIIAVCTSLGNFIQRQTIRESWGNTSEFNYGAFVKLHGHFKGNYLPPMTARLKHYAEYLSGEGDSLSASVRIVFIVRRSKYESLVGNETLSRVHSEADKYNDIIQMSFVDSYNNLTLKSVMALKHISRSCANSTAYFLKCDDDTFVNVPNLLHFLLGGSVPLYNDTLDYHDRYTFLVKSPHITRHHHPLFSFANSKHLCAFKGSITQHQVKDDTMVEAWNYVSDYKIRCPPPGRYFNHMRLHKRPNC
ncbi:uncharacterized protein LOC108158497 [Drosophila miranda]|uniref:uncharacterized protein LOC108158497 n=1 Tax=Drosophila miranda TaxID=7229 RepID=UPI00143F0C06|nr:uncharacterized protein LOC108158497 [Drosophila miranda]